MNILKGNLLSPVALLPGCRGVKNPPTDSRETSRVTDIIRLVKFQLNENMYHLVKILRLKGVPKEDIFNDVVAMVWHCYNKGDYDSTRGKFSNWVCDTAKYAVYDLITNTEIEKRRRRLAERKQVEEAYDDIFLKQVEDNDARHEYEKMLSVLDKETAEILHLRFVVGLTCREIIEQLNLNCSKQWISDRCIAALKEIRYKLTGNYDD